MSEPLTKNEKITVGLSVAALIVSIVSPFVAYRWLQSSVREQAMKEQGFTAAGRYGVIYNVENPKLSDVTYSVDLTNTGELPVDKVVISIRHYGQTFDNRVKETVEVNPTMPMRVDVSSSTLIIRFENALPPGQKATVSWHAPLDQSDTKVPISHPSAWVSSEASASIPIDWQFGGAGI
jgi:hypothetical protein